MTEPILPKSEEDLAGILANAAAASLPLAIHGGGTRGSMAGMSNGAPLSTSGLTGITLYEPAEMVISARAGTPLAEVEAALAEKGQMLPFEPMDHRVLLGTTGTPTIGAVAAGNISGPRRVSAGAARDHLIGVRFVNGRGEIIKSGGRVMKNVTGFDLVKLSAGAFGTLGVLTEVTFKILPRPQASLTLCLPGLPPETALIAMAEALATPFEVSAAAHMEAAGGEPSKTVLRVEGFTESCAYRAERLKGILSSYGKFELIAGETAMSLWRQIRDAEHFVSGEYETVLRVHVAPSKAADVLEATRPFAPATMLDWGGGLIWFGLRPGTSASQAMAGIAERGGHPLAVRGQPGIEPMRPASPAVAALARRVKQAFDPAGILNPGLLPGHI